MEKIIKIDIDNKHDFIDKYNEQKVSYEVVEYIIKQAMLAKKDDKIKIIINRKCYIEKDSIKLIKYGLQEEYERTLRERDENNTKQLFFLALGVVFIFLSTLIKEKNLWKELLLITGWVPIWEMIEMELFPDAAGRKERKIIKKLLHSEIIEKNELFE